MTMPDVPTTSAEATILLELGKIGSDVAVIKKVLEQFPELDRQVRQNTTDIAVLKAESATGRDVWARIWAGVGVLAAVGASVAVYIHH